MEKDYYNQRIQCNVSHCKYFDPKEEKCALGSISVGVNKHHQTCCETYEKNELK